MPPDSTVVPLATPRDRHAAGIAEHILFATRDARSDIRAAALHHLQAAMDRSAAGNAPRKNVQNRGA